MIEPEDPQHEAALLVHHNVAAGPDGLDVGEDLGGELIGALHRTHPREAGDRPGRRTVGVIARAHPVLDPEAVVGEGDDAAIGLLDGVEVLVSDRHQLRPGRRRRRGDRLFQDWQGLGQQVRLQLLQLALAGQHALHLGDPAGDYLQPQGHQGGIAVLLHQHQRPGPAQLGVGEVEAEGAQAAYGAPKPVAKRHRRAVLGEAQSRRHRQPGRTVGDERRQIAVGETRKAGAVARRL